MNMRKLILGLVCVVGSISCTEQERAKNFGGNATETLIPRQKLITITWKDNSLWYLTRPMRADEKAETYTFKESSSWGAMQGHDRRHYRLWVVTIKEQD